MTRPSGQPRNYMGTSDIDYIQDFINQAFSLTGQSVFIHKIQLLLSLSPGTDSLAETKINSVHIVVIPTILTTHVYLGHLSDQSRNYAVTSVHNYSQRCYSCTR